MLLSTEPIRRTQSRQPVAQPGGLTMGFAPLHPVCPGLLVVAIRHGTGSLGHRVNGSFRSSFTPGSSGHRVIILTQCETRVFPVFEKAQDKDIKMYFFVKIRPTVIEILIFDKRSSKFYFTFQERANAKQR